MYSSKEEEDYRFSVFQETLKRSTMLPSQSQMRCCNLQGKADRTLEEINQKCIGGYCFLSVSNILEGIHADQIETRSSIYVTYEDMEWRGVGGWVNPIDTQMESPFLRIEITPNLSILAYLTYLVGI